MNFHVQYIYEAVDKFSKTAKKMQASVAGLDKRMASLKEKAERMGSAMKSVGTKMTLGLTLPIALLGNKMIQAARDAEEVQNKYMAVFGTLGDVAEKEVMKMASAYNMANTEAKHLTANTGDLLTGLGMQKDKAFDLSMQTQKLAADLASYNDIPVKRASEAITKAMLGEREMMKGLGVVINEDMIKKKLQAEGMDKLTGMALMQAKAQLTLKMAMEQSKNAIGDVARSQDSLAYKEKALAVATRNASDSFGKLIVPIKLFILKYASKLLSFFSNLSPATKKIIIVVAGLAAVMGPVLIALGAIIAIAPAVGAAFAVMFGPVGLAVAGIGLLVVSIIDLYKNWDKFVARMKIAFPILQKIQNVFKWIKEAVSSVIETIKTFLAPLMAVVDAVKSVAGFLGLGGGGGGGGASQPDLKSQFADFSQDQQKLIAQSMGTTREAIQGQLNGEIKLTGNTGAVESAKMKTSGIPGNVGVNMVGAT